MPPFQCPAECPRKDEVARTTGKIGSYAFALLLSMLALVFSFEPSPRGGWQPKEEPPVFVWAIFLPIIGGCVGVQISPEFVGRLVGARQ